MKFAQIRKEVGAIVLLLAEPGLTLHGKAQADLLRYFADRILPEHQLVFSTHAGMTDDPIVMPPPTSGAPGIHIEGQNRPRLVSR